MRRKFAAALLWTLCCVAAQRVTALECAAPQLAKQEKLVCDDDELRKLDDLLNSNYDALLSRHDDPPALQTAELDWLSTFRDRCEDAVCLTAVYRARIADLGRELGDANEIADAPLTDREAAEVCDTLAVMGDEGRLYELSIPETELPPLSPDRGPSEDAGDTRDDSVNGRGFAIRLDRKGHIGYYTTRSTGGTCVAQSFMRVGHEDGEYEMERAGSDYGDDLHLVNWAGTEYPIHFRGRNLVVVADYLHRDAARAVFWIRPDGGLRPICKLDVTRRERTVVSAQDSALCAGVAERSIKPLEWRPVEFNPRPPRDEFVRRYGKYADGLTTLKIDVDGDGQTETIGRFDYASGAGCGSYSIWFAKLTDDLTAVVHGPLDDLLDSFSGTHVDTFDVDGRVYFAVANGAWASSGNLIKLGKGTAEEVCKFGQRTTHAVTKLFLPITDAHGVASCKDSLDFITRAICGSPALAALRDRLDELLRQHPDAAGTPESSQQYWIDNVRNGCRTEACVDRVYRSRITEVQARDAPKPPWLRHCRIADVALPADYALFAARAMGRPLDFGMGSSDRRARHVNVVVNSAREPAVLFLDGQASQIWNISRTEDTRIALVVAKGGSGRQAIAGLDTDVPLVIDQSSGSEYGCARFESSNLPDRASVEGLASQIFGREPKAAVTGAGPLHEVDHIEFGEPLPPGAKLLSSGQYPPEAFRPPDRLKPGLAGIEEAIAKGWLRKATAADVEGWRAAVARRTDLPPEAQPRKQEMWPVLENTWVVLFDFEFPVALEELVGRGSVSQWPPTFIVPAGVPVPRGRAAVCVLNLETLEGEITCVSSGVP
ncbi:MAG: hypothetical protein HY749_04980 [Gammaproteobacteria bacterium]|nr:hypothetical protein [Gammaproteobacteria bacterium]MBI5617689.1 hypothetical protein [Gammaproteobacteria bacterium]